MRTGRPFIVIPAGSQFGRLTTSGVRGHINGVPRWECSCQCGTRSFMAAGSALIHGRAVSCGCLAKKNNGLRPSRSEMGNSMRRAYNVWASMIQRCENPNEEAFRNYGAKGISVCALWRDSFDAFFSDMGEPPIGLTLDRIDSTAGYTPENCRWATRLEQNNNRPGWCFDLEINGRAMTLKEAWREFSPSGLTYRSVHKRIVLRSWPISISLLLHAGERA